jgi:hypothetical protein
MEAGEGSSTALTTLTDFRWLWIGLIGAVLVPVLGIGDRLAGVLEGLVPLPWGRIGLGILLFAAAAALHFRSHWVRSLVDVETERQRSHAAARLLEGVALDGAAGVNVIKENIDLVASGTQRQQESLLYLQGARAHADKLDQVFERLDGVRRRLEPPSDD